MHSIFRKGGEKTFLWNVQKLDHSGQKLLKLRDKFARGLWQSSDSDERLFFQQPINFEISDAKVQSLKIAFSQVLLSPEKQEKKVFL